jgi:hypothetical protein
MVFWDEGIRQGLRNQKARLLVQGRRDGTIAPGGEILDPVLKRMTDGMQAEIDKYEAIPEAEAILAVKKLELQDLKAKKMRIR